MTKFRVGDIRPNPFRDLARYPLDPAHVDRLRASIRSTGFWNTVVARKVDGVPELAFGHYRLEAARQEYGEDGRIPLNIEDLSDDQMLRMMAEENMEASRNAAESAHEVVRAVVLAYAEGRVALEEPPPNAPHSVLRVAPHFGRSVPGNESYPKLTYTVQTIAAYLGGTWSTNRVRNALSQLAAVEADDVSAGVFRGIGPRNAIDVVQAGHAAEREAQQAGMDEARAKEIGREVAGEVADGLRDGTISRYGSAGRQGSPEKMAVNALRRKAIEARVPPKPRPKRPPAAYKVAENLRDYIAQVFTRKYKKQGSYGELTEALIDNLGSLSLTQPLGPRGPNLELEIATALRALAEQATAYADRIDGGKKEIAV